MADISFIKDVAILDTALVNKTFDIDVSVLGNSGMADATATALGFDSHAQTLTETTSVFGLGSSAASQSVSLSGLPLF